MKIAIAFLTVCSMVFGVSVPEGWAKIGDAQPLPDGEMLGVWQSPDQSMNLLVIDLGAHPERKLNQWIASITSGTIKAAIYPISFDSIVVDDCPVYRIKGVGDQGGFKYEHFTYLIFSDDTTLMVKINGVPKVEWSGEGFEFGAPPSQASEISDGIRALALKMSEEIVRFQEASTGLQNLNREEQGPNK